MTGQNIPNQDPEEADAGANRRTHSRRALLASIGTGAAGVALSGVTGTASASGEGSPAAEFIESTSPATTATADGSWSDSAVWDNGVPTAGQTVRIESGVTVTVDTTTEKITNLDVAGTLTFARGVDTHLQAETVVTRPDSTLEIGTESNPIQQGSEARITFLHHEDLSEKDNDPQRISKGLVTMGDVEIHGAEKTSWTELATAPETGDTTLELPEAPTNWQGGDDLVVAPVEDPNDDERRVVTGVEGTTVSLDSALEADHRPPEDDLPVHVANLDRNVRLQSASTAESRRGHVMFMTDEGVHVANAGIYELGRTDKSRAITNPGGADTPGENRNARYPLHFHKTGIDRSATPHEIEGCVVQGSPGWGFVNHHSYVHVRDCVSYDVLGSGFVAEAGAEQGSFVGNIAIKSEGSGQNLAFRANEGGINAPSENPIDDFGHAGHGFWLHSPGVTVEDNVAAGHADFGFYYWGIPLDEEGRSRGEQHYVRFGVMVPPNYPKEYATFNRNEARGAPGAENESHISQGYVTIRSFADNTAYAVGSGVGLRWMKPQHHSGQTRHTNYEDYNRIERFTVYGIHREGEDPFTGGNGIAPTWSSHVWIRDCRLVGTGTGRGINRSNDWYGISNVMVQDTVVTGFQVGVCASPGPEGIISRCTLDNERTNVRSLAGDMHKNCTLWLHENTFRGAENNLFRHHDFKRPSYANFFDIQSSYWDDPDDATSEFLVLRANKTNVRLNDRKLYFEFQRPDVKPFEKIHENGRWPDPDWKDQSSELGAAKHIASDFGGDFDNTSYPNELDDPTKLVGMTNRELHDEYGLAAHGSMVPNDAERSDFQDLTWETPAAGTDVALASPTMPRPLPGMDLADEARVTVAPEGDKEFVPSSLTVEPGTTVAFEWRSDGHTVTVDSQPDGADWAGVDSTRSEGHIHTHTFDVAGSYEYSCRPHQSQMQGTITVDSGGDDHTPMEAAIDADDNGDIDDDEILDAVEHWQDEEPVPGIGGETISDQVILDLIDSWRDGGTE